jgi:hypothetical protein
MSKVKEFILNNDKMIVNALVLIVPTLLVLLGLLPMLIENYTFNSFLHGERDNYLDFSQAFKFVQLFAFGYMIIGLSYNVIRRMVEKDVVDKQSYLKGLNVSLAFIVAIAIGVAVFAIDQKYERKNIEFVQSKLIDIKKYIQAGKCVNAGPYTDSNFNDPEFGNVSECSTMEQKLPGSLYFRNSGAYTSAQQDLNGVVKTETKNEPNVMTYRGYFGPFCRSLKEKDNILYKEFDVIKVHGTSPLSDTFEQSSCETYKNMGQIEFMFK